MTSDAHARVVELMRAAAGRELSDPAAALAEVEKLAAEFGDDPLLDAARLGLAYARAVHEGDDGALDRFPQLARDTFPGGGTHQELVVGAAELVAAQQRGEDVSGRLADLLALADRLPPGDHARVALEEAGRSLTALNRDGGAYTDADLAGLEELTRRPGLSPADRALAHAQAGMAALGMGEETDPARVDLGISHLRRAVRAGLDADPQHVFHLAGLGLGLYRRGELTAARHDLEEARTVLLRARDLAGGPAHPQWTVIGGMLADIGQLLGDRAGFQHDALAGLRSYVWKVMVQPDLEGAAVAVRSAAADAASIARQCLAAGDPAGAVAALDAGRGLALFAATELRTIADRLAVAGEPALAERWRAAITEGPTPDLRREVVAALLAHDSAAGLLDPPGVAEIQDALAAVDADALVYLVPGGPAASGYAVAVAARGPVSLLPLPGLVAGAGAEFLAMLAAAEAVEEGGSLGPLGDWSWRAVIGPLIDTYVPRLHPPRTERPPRLVLVPIGDFARVPWQAARHRDGTYAIERIALSQAVSARMLCLAAALPPVPPTGTGLITGNPDTGVRTEDLRFAGAEGVAIRDSFYPGARFLGRRPGGRVSPSGGGTADQVRDWLTSAFPGAGGTLHLACHGVVRPADRDATAHLLLAGGETLTAEELGLLMARAPDRDIDLVVLSACRTGQAITGYDEAFSLGTAFLAGGVRSVLCTLWNVQDGRTSVLMYAFHHYLRDAGLPVWAALRAAQRWMLDPGREPFEGMPRPLARLARSSLLADPWAWAGVVHWGR